MARSVFQYEQPRCPDNWNEAERRFYNRLIETLDDIYSKYGRLDEKMLSKGVLNRIDNSTATSLEKMTADILSSGKIAADSIEATFAYLVSLSAKYGSFDFETVKNLVADAMVLEKGQADYVHITNLAATYAQAVNATIGNLVIQSSDGKYYQLDVSADGKVSASEVKPSDKEISAGETSEGKVIVGTHITAETLGTATLAATQALINMIDASRINVDTLVAREEFVQTLTANEAFVDSLVANTAFIKQLGTTTIVGDKSITMLAGEVDNLDRMSSIEVIEGTFVQTERREGEGIRIYSEIGPKQDLKWGAPWPGGAGKNLMPPRGNSTTVSGITITSNADGSVTYNGTATADVNHRASNYFSLPVGEYILSGCPQGGSYETYDLRLCESSGNVIKRDFGSGSQASLSEAAENLQVLVVIRKGTSVSNLTFYPMIRLASITDATYAPYANTPPIEGWTGLNAFAGGKNLCPFDEYTTPSSGNYSTGYMTKPALKPGESVMIYGQTTDGVVLNSGNCQLVFTGAAGTAGDEVWMPNPSTQPQIVPDGYVNAVQFRIYTTSALAGKTIRMMIEVGSATEWVPYQGNTYFLDFGEEVYGGKVDWHAGEMTVNKVYLELDGTEKFSGYASGAARLPMFTPALAPKISGDIYSNMLKSARSYGEVTSTPNSVAALQNGIVLHFAGLQGADNVIFTDIVAKLTSLKAAGTPVQLVYELAEPYTIQLTSVQIETIQGINTVYTDADGGRVEFGHSPIEDIQSAVNALEEAQAESALYLKLDAENKVVRIGQTEVTSEFDIDAYGAGVVVGGKVFSRFEGERVLIGDMEMRKPANIGGLAFDSIMT